MAQSQSIKPKGTTTLQYRHASVANAILSACYDLDVVEKRAVFITLSHMNSKEQADSTKIYSMYVTDYATLCGVEYKNAYEALQYACDKLWKREIIVSKNEKFRWIQYIKFNKEEKRIDIKWSADIIPYISSLSGDSPFTRLLNKDVIPIESKYSMRLLELIEQERFKGLVGKKTVELAWLYEVWCIPDSRRDFGTFKARILNPAIKELRERNLMDIKIYIGRENRIGNKTVSVTFEYLMERYGQAEVS